MKEEAVSSVRDEVVRTVIFDSLREDYDFEDEERAPYKKSCELLMEAAEWMKANPRHHLRGVSIYGDDQSDGIILRVEPMDRRDVEVSAHADVLLHNYLQTHYKDASEEGFAEWWSNVKPNLPDLEHKWERS